MKRSMFENGVSRQDLDHLLATEVYGRMDGYFNIGDDTRFSRVEGMLGALLTLNAQPYLKAIFAIFGGNWSSLEWKKEFRLQKACITGAQDNIITLTSALDDSHGSNEGIEMLFGCKHDKKDQLPGLAVIVCDMHPIIDGVRYQKMLYIFSGADKQKQE